MPPLFLHLLSLLVHSAARSAAAVTAAAQGTVRGLIFVGHSIHEYDWWSKAQREGGGKRGEGARLEEEINCPRVGGGGGGGSTSSVQDCHNFRI